MSSACLVFQWNWLLNSNTRKMSIICIWSQSKSKTDPMALGLILSQVLCASSWPSYNIKKIIGILFQKASEFKFPCLLIFWPSFWYSLTPKLYTEPTDSACKPFSGYIVDVLLEFKIILWRICYRFAICRVQNKMEIFRGGIYSQR